jgi:curved DNA-binding protein CbpA
MSTVNLYDVLNISHDCTIKDIKTAYRKLVLEFHPDKLNGDAEMFELITHAYNILVNPKTRNEYDSLYTLSKQSESSHFDLKSKSRDYYEAQKTDKIKKKKSKDEYELEFKKASEEMDRKRGYQKEKADKISEKDINNLFKDLKMVREHEDIDNMHDNLFEGSFDLGKFNAVFDEMYKGHSELIPHTGTPEAWNSISGGSYGSIDNYSDPFAEDEDVGTTLYSSIKQDNTKNTKLTKEDIKKISSASYTKGHDFKDPEYNKSIEEKLKERELQTLKLNDREFKDYVTDPSCGGYGIFDQLGIKNVGNISWDNSEDISIQYKKLLEMRKSNIEL